MGTYADLNLKISIDYRIWWKKWWLITCPNQNSYLGGRYYLSQVVSTSSLAFIKKMVGTFGSSFVYVSYIQGGNIICKFEKDPINNSGTSLYTPILKLGQVINHPQKLLNTLHVCLTNFLGRVLYLKNIFFYLNNFPPTSISSKKKSNIRCHYLTTPKI